MSEQEVELVEEQEKVVLEEREAFALLRQGAGVWNAWVERNPVAEVFMCRMSTLIPFYFFSDRDTEGE